MKAKEVMAKYGICRETLGNWVKKGLIKYDKTPSGRYIYIIEDYKNKDKENKNV